MVIFLGGKYVEDDKAEISVFDHGFLYADGVYETLRTYGGKIWQVHEHLARLGESARMIGLDLPWSLSTMDKWIQETVRRNGFAESRIRVTVTRGSNGFDFGAAKKPTICIQVQRLIPEKPALYSRGVGVVTFNAERFLPRAKSLNLLPMILGQQFMLKKSAYEALFVSGGRVLEGTVTNVFVVKNGVLITPRRGVLLGTTREALLKVARRLLPKNGGRAVAVRQADITLRQLHAADEVFITNAPKGIVPVVKVDGRAVGRGVPGPVTKLLMKAFDDYIEASLKIG